MTASMHKDLKTEKCKILEIAHSFIRNYGNGHSLEIYTLPKTGAAEQ